MKLHLDLIMDENNPITSFHVTLGIDIEPLTYLL